MSERQSLDELDVTVAHWGEHVDGGGERVAQDIADCFETELHVGVKLRDSDSTELPSDGIPKRLAKRGGLGQMVGYQFLWERPEPLVDADVIVTSGNEPLAYVPTDGQTWVAYVHHTSRYATDLLDIGVDKVGGVFETPKRLAYRLLRKAERNVLGHYAQKPDHIVVNSEVVARRVNRYWGVPERDISVVYPGVDVHRYGRDVAPTRDVFLTLSRLDNHKRIDQIIDAFRKHPEKQLYVAGTGPEEEHLKEMAPSNVVFLGFVSEQRKRELMSEAQAFLVNAAAEDFGLTTVEALASGTPVIGVEEGMTQFLAADGRGVTYPRGVESLSAAISEFVAEGVEKSPQEIERFADRFSVTRFKRELRDLVRQVRETSRVDVDWETVDASESTPAIARADGGEHD